MLDLNNKVAAEWGSSAGLVGAGGFHQLTQLNQSSCKCVDRWGGRWGTESKQHYSSHQRITQEG